MKKKDNATAVACLLINALHVKINPGTVEACLKEHPEYPSLLAVSDCLTEWNIPNQAYKISRKDYDANELEFPFIAHLNTNGGYYMMVHELTDGRIVYSDEERIRKNMSEQDFLKIWSGIVLSADVNENSGEENYPANRLKESFNRLKVPLLLLVILGIVLLNINNVHGWSYFVLLGIKLAGTATSILLLMHSIDANNPLIQNLCSLGSKNNCNVILRSDAAQLTPWLSWSDVGFFYFSGSFLSLLLIPASLPLLKLLNVFSLPFIVFSINYQYQHKNWCILCCFIQAFLLLEFLTSLSSYWFSDLPDLNFFMIQVADYSPSAIPAIVFCFLTPILTWSVLKPGLLKSAQFNPMKKQLLKFKYNSELFNQALTSQPRYAVPDDLMPISLGNPNAETTITMVTNPFCGPCAKAHETLDKWLSVRDDINIKIIFTTADHDDDDRTKIARHVTALSLLNDTKLVSRALNDWYKQSGKKYDSWASKYPVNFKPKSVEKSNSVENVESVKTIDRFDNTAKTTENVENVESVESVEMALVTAKQKAWCNLTEIAFTPTILINGYKLPDPYRLEDIKYLIN
ncbi:peptidase C39-like protein [Pedobacter metabolipauper]|uniref:Peptidase C39-like protein n=2 Tax=Pedobacter metabolipauper TaxID=425513 RepID=A0A4V3D1M4_9SPHI|nr:peptidase C39-like protein [Pedobacter metabolipauper]